MILDISLFFCFQIWIKTLSQNCEKKESKKLFFLKSFFQNLASFYQKIRFYEILVNKKSKKSINLMQQFALFVNQNDRIVQKISNNSS